MKEEDRLKGLLVEMLPGVMEATLPYNLKVLEELISSPGFATAFSEMDRGLSMLASSPGNGRQIRCFFHLQGTDPIEIMLSGPPGFLVKRLSRMKAEGKLRRIRWLCKAMRSYSKLPPLLRRVNDRVMVRAVIGFKVKFSRTTPDAIEKEHLPGIWIRPEALVKISGGSEGVVAVLAQGGMLEVRIPESRQGHAVLQKRLRFLEEALPVAAIYRKVLAKPEVQDSMREVFASLPGIVDSALRKHGYLGMPAGALAHAPAYQVEAESRGC